MSFGSNICDMLGDVDEIGFDTVAQLGAFLEEFPEVPFRPVRNDVQRYGLIANVLDRFAYDRLARADKGVVLRYLARITGYSRAQLKRLVSRHLEGEVLAKRYRAPAVGFARKFTAADVKLLAQTDALHDTLSGPATKYLMQRAYFIYGDARYARLAAISVAHLYNLRRQFGYQGNRPHWAKTRGYFAPVGRRHAPDAYGCPGFIRIDAVRQGDRYGTEGLYYIYSVDCVTGYEIVAACERLSKAFLPPVLQQILAGFPFAVLGFHTERGSNGLCDAVARLLDELRIESTPSRTGCGDDNRLAQTGNVAVARRHFGLESTPQRLSVRVNTFCRDFLDPYVNFHRPCSFAEIFTDSRGGARKRYLPGNVMTPYEKLKSLPKARSFLKPGISFGELDLIANAVSDNEAARRLDDAGTKLSLFIQHRSKHAA